MKTTWEHMSYWRVAFGRALLYMFVVGTTDFLMNTEEWSQATWNDTGPFMLTRLFLGTAAVMVTVLIAFLDSTMTELRNKADSDVKSHSVTTTTVDKPAEEDK